MYLCEVEIETYAARRGVNVGTECSRQLCPETAFLCNNETDLKSRVWWRRPDRDPAGTTRKARAGSAFNTTLSRELEHRRGRAAAGATA